MTKTAPLTETERQTIIHALHVAAEQFDKDAVICAESTMENGLTHERLIKCFRDQAETTRRWAEAIENAGEVTIR